MQEKVISETLSKVLYPNDEPEARKRLRRLVLAAGHAMSARSEGRTCFAFRRDVHHAADDTHPAIAVAELMRLLVDERLLSWEEAWDIPRRALAYTNHTLLPEALETWGLPLFGRLLPRPLEIIYEINRRFLDEVRQIFPGDEPRVARMSIIDEAGEKKVRMAHLSTIGCHAVNGVAALHSSLLTQTVLRDCVTPRRFILLANPRVAQLLDETVGKGGSLTSSAFGNWRRTPTIRRFGKSGVQSSGRTKRCWRSASAT
ncbi:glycogen/starch/alpha-glucan phosphorylase [Paraburkholderia sp. CNPSo 3076]|nr:glycogen/starch/alpha-glucan phosphorylase [Paraburkholderia sp. CNPSo 3076]MCX5540042.1 glycogen/starch/alpha-glucan phosphorylase [Paraburkholderia sp. CNPSo 3076]